MISFRKFTDSDFETMYRWLQEPHMKEWWDDGDDTLEKVVEHYTRDEEVVAQYILVHDENQPIGYFQHYMDDENVIGIDQFIGEKSFINKGIGTQAVRKFVKMIRSEFNPATIIVDPEPGNHRAIRCYEKAGFRFSKLFVGEDGQQAYLMKLDLDIETVTSFN